MDELIRSFFRILAALTRPFSRGAWRRARV